MGVSAGGAAAAAFLLGGVFVRGEVAPVAVGARIGSDDAADEGGSAGEAGSVDVLDRREAVVGGLDGRGGDGGG